MEPIICNREEAGYLLSKKLSAFKRSNAVVVGIPHGGVCVAAVIAEELILPLEIMACRKIKNPANSDENIGSVSEDDVFLHDCSRTIPQEYLRHRILQLQRSILVEKGSYYGIRKPLSFRYRPVILVDDLLISSDSMIACLRSIRKQSPLKIVVAVALASAEAARSISAVADDIEFIKIEPLLMSPEKYFQEFPKVNEDVIRQLMLAPTRAFT